MAISGIVLLGYVLAHMIGNLKVFLGKGEINAYADWLRTLGEPAAPAHGRPVDPAHRSSSPRSSSTSSPRCS